MTQTCLLGGVVVAGFIATGCGDPMLPSDYAGPPASAVRGTVAGSSGDAERPHLALAWLAPDSIVDQAMPLLGQSLSFQRSAGLHSDWDIGLAFPADAAKLNITVGERPVRLAVAKMVYFDDRVADARLDWSCRAATCDVVKAVSAQFVVYIDAPPTCTTRTGIRPRVSAGYHYYAHAAGSVRELAATESMSFTLIDRSVADSNPTTELRAFLGSLLWSWTLTAVDGC